MKSYNVSVEDMHVVLYGFIQNILKLNHIDIIPDEVVPYFYDRDTSGDVESGDVSKFYECLKVSCTVDISTYINKQTKKNTKHSPNSTKEDWLYKYICKKTGRVNTYISMQFELIDPDQTKPNTYPNFQSLYDIFNATAIYNMLQAPYSSTFERAIGWHELLRGISNDECYP